MDSSLVRYRSIVADTERWDGFEFRDGDIIISTPPKCGTTWTQTICALLIFGTPDFPRPLDRVSPWLEQLTKSVDEVVALLEAQTHRRFIKSHTPLDGIPFDERVTYVTVGRDPRDVALSWDNHMANLDIPAFLALREKAVGLDDLQELMPPMSETPIETLEQRFWVWVDTPADPLQTSGMGSTLHHLRTFWCARDKPNVILLHYGDLLADLEAEMRKLAEELGIDTSGYDWPALVKAATFGEMKRQAKEVGPNQTESIWLDGERFFNKGTSGQWREILDADGLRRYEARVKELADPDFSDWLHQGPISVG